MNSAAILSHDSFSLNLSVRSATSGIRDELRPIFEPAGKNHVAPVAGPVLAVLRIVEQLVDDALAFVLGRIEHERGDVLRRGNVADDIQPHAAEVGGVVDSRREFGVRLEDFGRDQLDRPRGPFARHAGGLALSSALGLAAFVLPNTEPTAKALASNPIATNPTLQCERSFIAIDLRNCYNDGLAGRGPALEKFVGHCTKPRSRPMVPRPVATA